MHSQLRVFVLGLMGLVLFGTTAHLDAQQGQGTVAHNDLPDAPSSTIAAWQSGGAGEPQQPGSDPGTPGSTKPQQNSAQTPIDKKQPKRILWIIPNYRAVSADANVPPLDSAGKFKLMVDDSFDYSAFIYTGLIAGIGQARNSYPEFHQGAAGYGRYYWHSFVDQAVGDFFTEWAVPTVTKQDPRYFTKGSGNFFTRAGYAVSRLVITRTDSGGTALNVSEIIGNGAAAGISNLYYPSQERTWTKTGQKWVQQLALDGVFDAVKEFWPDIQHNILRIKQ